MTEQLLSAARLSLGMPVSRDDMDTMVVVPWAPLPVT